MKRTTPEGNAASRAAEADSAEVPVNAPSAAAVWLVIMKAHRSLQALMERSIASLGIGVSDFMILEALLHKGPMKTSTLGEKVHLANASMTAAIDRMEKRGLVDRHSDDADRRVRTIGLTPQGRALIRRLFARHEQDIDALMEPLGPAQRLALRQSLKTVGFAAQAALHAAMKATDAIEAENDVPVDSQTLRAATK